jgi:hypothetical protein
MARVRYLHNRDYEFVKKVAKKLSENKPFIVFGFMNSLSNMTMIVSIVQQNQPSKTYMRMSLHLYE